MNMCYVLQMPLNKEILSTRLLLYIGNTSCLLLPRQDTQLEQISHLSEPSGPGTAFAHKALVYTLGSAVLLLFGNETR